MVKLRVALIAAIGQNRELGKANKLLWHIPEDLKRFKQLTSGHIVIMGRKTFASIGRPLPQRTNIIVTRNKNYTAQGCITTHSITEALNCARRLTSNLAAAQEIFIIGGAQLYQQSINFADTLYLTLVHASFPDADTFFPAYSAFSKTAAKETRSSAGYKYTFLTLEK